MISLKKLLSATKEDDASPSRVIWLILEAVAGHAVESDPLERENFQVGLRKLVAQMEESKNSDETFLLAGEAIKSIETYNRAVQRAINAQVKELQSIVSMFTKSLLQVSKGSTASATKLHQLERMIEKSSQSEDLRVIKAQLEKSLAVICDEAAEQERRGEELSTHLGEVMNRPEAVAALAEAVPELDLVTGLPNYFAAEQAVRAAIASNSNAYIALLCVERLEVINNRFGATVGDRILMLFGQRLAQCVAKNDQLFRWRGPGFLVVLNRECAEISVRAEIARMVSVRMEEEVELNGRSVLLPISSSWMLSGVANMTYEKVLQKLTTFSTAQAAGVSR